MKTIDFDYKLPNNSIAQSPLDNRSNSRLMVLDRNNKSIKDDYFYNLVDYLDENSVIVRNNTRVTPARIYGYKKDTNGKCEVLILNEENDLHKVLIKPARRFKSKDTICFSDELEAMVVKKEEEGIFFVKFLHEKSLINILQDIGNMPLPPYIHEKLKNSNNYQTIYAKHEGSIAAPTAGFHFTNEVFEKIKEKNIEILDITLHVGMGTFKPIVVDEITDHKMHQENYFIDDITAMKLNEAIKSSKTIIAVGTTTVRTLEDNYLKYNKIRAGKESTSIFIYPSFKFNVVNQLITNFHLPKSTLLMLVSAFYNKNEILKAYDHAINNEYRFFSFGDSMLIK